MNLRRLPRHRRGHFGFSPLGEGKVFRMRHTTVALATLAIVLGGAVQASADTAYSYTTWTSVGNEAAGSGSGYVLGFAFKPNADISVSALGYFDYQGNGLAEGHQVGIFSSSGTLLTSTTVTSTSTLGAGDFRYAALAAAYNLEAGQQYTIAARTGDDDLYASHSSSSQISFSSDLTFLGNRWKFDTGSLSNPTSQSSDYYLASGPNFQFAKTAAAAVPLPAAAWGGMALFGGIGAARAARRRRG